MKKETDFLYDYVDGLLEGQSRFRLDGKMGLLGEDGNITVKNQYSNLGYMVNGKVSFVENDKYGFIDMQGNVIVPNVYNAAGNFSLDTDKVWVVNEDEKYLFIDAKGNELFGGRIFDKAKNFLNGYAPVNFGDGMTYIDENGNTVAKYYEDLSLLCTVEDDRYLGAAYNGEKWGYVDENMNVVIDFQFEDAQDFNEGYAVVGVSGQKYHIDANGTRLPGGYDAAWNFSDGMAAYLKDDKYGYDSVEHDALPAKYEEVWSFHGGLCPVKPVGSDRWEYINKEGETVLSGNRKYANVFVGDFAVIQEGDYYGVINRQGEEVIAPNYKVAIVSREYDNKVMVAVKQNDLWGFVSINEKE